MNQVATLDAPTQPSVTLAMANRYGMMPQAFEATVRQTCMPNQKVTKEQFAAFLLVAKEYDLNPILKEIYAFPTRGGGIQPIVSIDGWMNMINSHPNMNGMEFDDHLDENGKLTAITARIWRRDREHPVVVTEYMDECQRQTEPWTKWPRRMLRHKAAIQCARYAFGFAGIIDPDEADRMRDVGEIQDVTPAKPSAIPSPPPAPEPEPPDDAMATLPENESATMKAALLRKLGEVPSTTDDLAGWQEEREPAMATLTDDDRAEVQRELDARFAEAIDAEVVETEYEPET